MARRRYTVSLLALCLLLGVAIARAQAPAAVQPAAEPPTGPLQAVTARKIAIQQQLEALKQSNLSKEDQDTTRANFEQLLKVLTTLEEALQKRTAFLAQLEGIPKRLRALAEEQQTLATQPRHQFPTVTEALREDYEAQLHTLDTEIQELHQQTAAGEMRIAAIAKDLEQHAEARLQLERELLVARSQTPQAGEQMPEIDVELLELRLQLLQAEMDILEAERDWLTKRAPMQDALLSVTQVRREIMQQDLETIKHALETAFQQEQSRLNSTAATIENQLGQTIDPLEALKLTVGLETIDLLKITAEYRHRLNMLGDDILLQEHRNAQVKQDVDRMTSLVEKYVSGEGIAQRLLVTFERLRNERLRYSDVPAKTLETQLQALTMQLFTLDDQIYDFKQQMETRLAGISAALQPLPPAQRDTQVAKIRAVFDEQKTARREQQQVLSTLVQDTTQLLTLHREYKRLLDDSYLFVLTRMFWLRDAKALDWNTVQDMLHGATSAVHRLQAFLQATQVRLQTTWQGALHLWLLAFLVVLVLPWGICKAGRILRHWQMPAHATAAQSLPAEIGVAAVLMVRTILWPGYVLLFSYLLGYVLPQGLTYKALSMALVSGLQMSALTLGASLLGGTMLQPHGWGQRFWGLNSALCQFLRLLVLVTCVAVLLFLVPRQMLLTAPGDGEVAVGSLALARFCFLAFQSVVVILVWLLGRRNSPLMDTILARSRERDGLLWRIWPFVHLLLLAGVLGIVGLDVLGYRYAARFIWLRALGSLSVVLLLRLLLVMLVLRALRALVGYIFSMGGRLQRRYPDVEAAATRYFHMLSTLSKVVLILLAAAVILELWGFSVTWFLTSPFGTRLLMRVLIIALTVASTAVVVQISNALTDYLLQPRTTRHGLRHEPSRKLKTLAPLIQTLIKVGAVFAAILVTLEQLGISTGPILTGVGIFGLAVGFASQSLIKDVINGLFILFEDSLSVGDVVRLRSIDGQVEKVTLRAVTIRDLAGSVHVIPNGTIDMITNMTKDYSRYILDIGVAYRENTDDVISILREIDAGMRQDPVYGRDMLEPIEILGLDRFEDSAVIIRARLKTRPLQQWRIGREFNRRIKMMFDERGIEMPFPHCTVYFGAAKDGSPPALPLSIATEQPARRQDAY